MLYRQQLVHYTNTPLTCEGLTVLLAIDRFGTNLDSFFYLGSIYPILAIMAFKTENIIYKLLM